MNIIAIKKKIVELIEKLFEIMNKKRIKEKRGRKFEKVKKSLCIIKIF